MGHFVATPTVWGDLVVSLEECCAYCMRELNKRVKAVAEIYDDVYEPQLGMRWLKACKGCVRDTTWLDIQAEIRDLK